MKLLVVVLPFLFFLQAHAQQAAYFDAAQAYNKLMIEKNSGSYRRVGGYKVIGSPYLFGEKKSGDVYSSMDSGNGILLSYNTYNQDVEFLLPGANANLVKSPGALDSFVIRKDTAQNLLTDLKFIYGPLLGSKDKAYFQVITAGKRLTLYKKYTAELGNVSTNYIQSELRQFNILVDYYYTDSLNDGMKKLKTSSGNLIKEFAKVRDLRKIIDEDVLVTNKEMELMKLFLEMNKD